MAFDKRPGFPRTFQNPNTLPPGGTTGQAIVKSSGDDFDVEWSDAGSVGGSFLPAPDLIDDADLTYFYFGWIDQNDSWLIQRQERLASLTTKATGSTNPTYANLSESWVNRTTLSYS